MNFRGSNSSLCDSSGVLLFYSNGEKLYNAGNVLVQNGNNLNATNQHGLAQQQGVLSLPFPGRRDTFLVLVSEIKYVSDSVDYAGIKVYKNLLEFSSNSQGKMFEKKSIVIEDTLEYGQIVSCKHANGRDWWILVPESFSNRYYTLLLDPAGLHLVDTQAVGPVFIDGLGQAAFSPDGSKFARAIGIRLDWPLRLYYYQFDRCTGKLSDPIYTEYVIPTGLGVGCFFSPDSRYLYAVSSVYLYQFDTEAADLAASKTLVAEWDWYIWENIQGTDFTYGQLAPDGKVYLSTAGGTPYLHVIDYPNRQGASCSLRQRGVHLYNLNLHSISDFPHFRIGPIDGSACDTLGLDNRPVANWRWNIEDSTELLRVTFTDLSAYEPDEWHWDFGDGSISQDTSPAHLFPAEGVYPVCQVVGNAFHTDTFCMDIKLGVSAWNDPELQSHIQVRPNPFRERLYLALSAALPAAQFSLYDYTGRLCLQQSAPYGVTAIDVGHLSPGVYFWALSAAGQVVKSGKAIRQ